MIESLKKYVYERFYTDKIAEIAKLKDEIESLWFIIEEAKRAEIENHSAQFQESIDKSVQGIKQKALAKTAEA
jgi:hypothetical protein